MLLGSITAGSLAVGIAGVLAALAGVAYAVLHGRREEETTDEQLVIQRKDLARDEAMALANTRAEAIKDLETAIAKLREEQARDRQEHLETVERLQNAVDLIRDQAFEAHQMFAHSVRVLLMTVLGDLDRDPPLVDVAIGRIRQALSEDPPPGPRSPFIAT